MPNEKESKIRAVSYSRVSTEEEKQLNALTKQIMQNRELMISKGWIFIREYIDEGKSGTQTKSRSGYNHLYEDLSKDEFDIVVIKDQDRLMRNTKDWYLFIERMAANHKQLYIYLDQTFYNPDNSLLTGIKAILAEEYSRHLSKKINNAHQHRQQKGESPIITSRTWGYSNINGRIKVDEAERKIIEDIFNLYAEGVGSRSISRNLNDKGIRNRNGGILSESTIREIVKNPIYKGTAVMHKTHIDFATKEKRILPREEWIYHENAVPPIVSSELWQAANATIAKNSSYVGGSVTGQKRGSALLSGKIVCGECGDKFWRNKRNLLHKNTDSMIYWYCSRYYRFGSRRDTDSKGCSSMRLKEDEIESCLIRVGKQLLSDSKKTELFNRVCRRIKDNSMEETREGEILQIQKQEEKLSYKQKRLMDLLIDEMIEKNEYTGRINQIVQQREKLTEQRNQLLAENTVLLAADAEGETCSMTVYQRIRREMEGNMDYYIILPFIACHTTEIQIYADRLEIMTDLKQEAPCLVKKNELFDIQL